jgi:hypothetical protein
MASLNISLDQASRKVLKETLNPRQAKQAIFQVVKRTTSKVSTIIKQKVRGHSLISVKYVNRVIDTKLPRGEPPEGLITVKREAIPLVAFPYKKAGRGISVQFTRDQAPVVFRHAFETTMASGHTGVYERARRPSAHALGISKDGRPYRRLTPSGFAERLPIDEAMGPSVFKLVQLPKILGEIEFDASAYMRKMAQSQLARFARRQPIIDE